MLPYALFRWGAGREAAVGLGVILTWLAITHVADPTATAEAIAEEMRAMVGVLRDGAEPDFAPAPPCSPRPSTRPSTAMP